MTVEIFARQDDVLGEGPLWSADELSLYWIDIGRKRLHRRTLGGVSTAWDLPQRPGCVEMLTTAGLAITLGSGVHRFDTESGAAELIYPVPLGRDVRFNEGKADPRGRLWFGSMQENFGSDGQPVPVDHSVGTLFRLDTNGTLAAIEERVGISNTLAWPADESRFYFADSLLDRIFVYDYDPDSGNVANKRLFFQGDRQGLPDGSAVDVDGCLWNVRWGVGLVLRITPGGKIDRQIEIPALQPSSCAFGGPRLDTLFVTSARHGMGREYLERSPMSGSVFAVTGAGQGTPGSAMRWNT